MAQVTTGHAAAQVTAKMEPTPRFNFHEFRAFSGLTCVLCVLLQGPSGTEVLAEEKGTWPRTLALQSHIRHLVSPLRCQVTQG